MPVAADSSYPHSLRVLLVEDHEVNEQVLGLMLRQLGCDVVVARDGETAVAWARDGYDVILMDCGLPVMDGYEAARRIRAADPAGPAVPIVAVTAYAGDADREKALAAGMDAWLPKPISKAELSAVIGELVQRPIEKPAPSEPVLDAAIVDQLAELALPDDPEFFVRLVCSFRDAAARSLAEVDSLLDEGEPRAARRHLHRLRSAASTVGAMRLFALCISIEEKGDEALVETRQELGEALREHVGLAVGELMARARSTGTSP